MLESSPFMTQSLSLQANQHKPAGALEALFGEQTQDQPLDQMLATLMTSLDPEEQARRLAQHPDGLPLPVPLSWTAWDEEETLVGLDSAERRLYHSFDQVLMNRRKSGKYLAQFQELVARYPERETLAQLELSYRFLWEPPELVRPRAEAVLARHPGWLVVRLLLARSFLHEDHLDTHRFEATLQQRLLLHEHLPFLETPLTDLLVYQFHLDLYLYFALTGRLKRAAYAYNLCSRAATSEAMLSLAPLLLATVSEGPRDRAFQELLNFLKP